MFCLVAYDRLRMAYYHGQFATQDTGVEQTQYIYTATTDPYYDTAVTNPFSTGAP